MKLIDNNPSGKSRSEAARQRRVESSQKRLTRVNSNVVSPNRRAPGTAPVLVRGGSMTAPARQKTRTRQPRRQFYYSVGTTGAEIRIPAIPMVHLGWRLLSGVIVLVMLAGIFLAYNSPTFKVDQLKITGLQRLTAKDVEEVVNIHNTPIFAINPSQLRTDLLKEFPEFADVQVKIGLPASVTVTADERVPVLIWQYKDEPYWVDKGGYVFNPRGKANGLVTIKSDEKPPLVFTSVPTTGASGTTDTASTDAPTVDKTQDPGQSIVRQTMDTTVLNAAIKLRKMIPAGTEITYTAQNGLGWVDPAGWNVYVGIDLENIDLKMKLYDAVVAKLSQDGVTPVMISVENVDAPFYRLEQ